MRAYSPWFSIFLLTLFLTGCGSGVLQYSTTVAPLASEDIAAPCRYDIDTIAPGTQKGVLVLFERGDTIDLYQDIAFREAIQSLHFTLVWAHQCQSMSEHDLQPDATKGQTRMLFAALSNLAILTGHPELATSKVVLYGFSAAGVLTASMANDHPGRLLGTIQYAAGSAYLDLDDISVSSAASSIPTLVLANAQDEDSGTSRSYRYFQRGRSLGAFWAYAVQNQTTHCCNLSTRSIIVPWIEALATSKASYSTAQDSSTPSAAGTTSHFVCSPDGVEDAQGEVDCKFVTAGLGPGPSGLTPEGVGWLPDQASGAAWLTWVSNSATN